MPSPSLFRRSESAGPFPRPTTLGVLLALLILVTACSSTVSGNAVVAGDNSADSNSTGSSTPRSSGTPAPIPVGLERFYNQELDWGSCAGLATSDDRRYFRSASLQCATLTVPLVYADAADPAAPTISIGVLRKVATDPGNRIGSLVVNPGGPGGSGVEYAGQLAGFGIAAAVNERFDFVGFDPRGVGSSSPLVSCQTDAERDATRAQTTRTRTQQEIDAANAATEQIAQQCVQRTGLDDDIDGATFLGNIGTRDVAKDMDVLRAALGDDQLTYFGGSYGTLLGTVYAELFPNNVRAMILDGAVDPNADPTQQDVGQLEGFQQAFEDFAAWCADQDTCPLGTNPDAATANFQALVRPLLDTPLALADGRVLAFDDATIGTIAALYSDSAWGDLSAALEDLSNGKGDALMAQADGYDGRDAKGQYSNFLDVLTAVHCMDDLRMTDPAARQAAAEKYAAAAPFVDSGDPPAALKNLCDFWPVEPTLTPHQPDVRGLPQVLVISTTGDPATPYQAGVDLAEGLDARLLTVEGTRHGAYLGAGLECVDEIGTQYLTTLELPKEGTTCS